MFVKVEVFWSNYETNIIVQVTLIPWKGLAVALCMARVAPALSHPSIARRPLSAVNSPRRADDHAPPGLGALYQATRSNDVSVQTGVI